MAAVDGTVFDFFGITGPRAYLPPVRDGSTFDPVGTLTGQRVRPQHAVDGYLFFAATSGPAPMPIFYRLAAIDTGVGRRYWVSQSVDFTDAPIPSGSWDTASLTIMSSWE